MLHRAVRRWQIRHWDTSIVRATPSNCQRRQSQSTGLIALQSAWLRMDLLQYTFIKAQARPGRRTRLCRISLRSILHDREAPTEGTLELLTDARHRAGTLPWLRTPALQDHANRATLAVQPLSFDAHPQPACDKRPALEALCLETCTAPRPCNCGCTTTLRRSAYAASQPCALPTPLHSAARGCCQHPCALPSTSQLLVGLGIYHA